MISPKNDLTDRQIGIRADELLALPAEHLERVESWGRASSAMSYVYRPSTIGQIRELVGLARGSGRSVGLRGAGNSYGDASLNSENISLDMRRFNRILDWDPASGIIRVESGVTIKQLWQHVLEDGWWPAVVPGTMRPTIGGCIAMNVHGKNAWKEGPIGDQVHSFELLLASGESLTCSREQNSDLFYAAIGGLGMLGVLTSATIKMKRVFSGLLNVEAIASRSLEEMVSQFEQHLANSDYLVGWIDAFAGGKSLGRGQIHRATYPPPGADPYPSQSYRLDRQHLPDTLFGVLPKSMAWRLMRPLMNNIGARLTNTAKYWSSRLTHGKTFEQPHAAFHFLLDYVPDWKRSYGPGGLIQYQCFIPADKAPNTLRAVLELCQRRGLPNYLSVLKRHRPDNFLMSHSLDGYSLAMDFRVTERRRPRLVRLAAELDAIVLDAGGRFYFAKDSTLRPEVVRAFVGESAFREFHRLKREWDPDCIWQTNLWRRLFAT